MKCPFENVLLCCVVWINGDETVYKTWTNNLELSTTPLTNGCRNDDMTQLSPLHSQSLFHLSRSPMHIFTHSLAIVLTCCNQLDSNLAMIAELNIRPFEAILSDYSGFSWLKMIVLSLCRTNVVWLVIKPSHIMDLTLR